MEKEDTFIRGNRKKTGERSAESAAFAKLGTDQLSSKASQVVMTPHPRDSIEFLPP